MMRSDRQIVVALTVSAIASIALVATYVVGGDNRLQGLLLAVGLGGIGWAVVAAAHTLLDGGTATEARHDLGSTAEQRTEVERELAEPATRRGFLMKIFAGAVGALGVAIVAPLESLGRTDESALRSVWREGLRLVDEAGRPVNVDTLAVGGAVTVFPEGHMGEAQSIVILVRLSPSSLALPSSRRAWAPEGYLAYSKVCTHAGCPVGLFDGETGLLTCPCHQSAFQTRSGAVPIAGPAARPLPQLPLRIDNDGNLVAAGPMDRAVGPGYWDQGA